MPSILAILFALLVLLPLPAGADSHGHEPAGKKAKNGLAVSVSFDQSGRLWRARVDGDYLLVDHADAPGAPFSPPVSVNQKPEKIAAEGEARPNIAIGVQGEVFVAWTQPLPAPYSGHIRFARSLDDGKTFSAPLTVNDNQDEITHRFQSLLRLPDGRIVLAWIDKRDGVAAKKAGQDYRGAAVWYAVSSDGGASFQANRRHARHSCECCRLALAADLDGWPLVFWRHVFADGSRDHALSPLGSSGEQEEVTRATAQHWRVNACPHHGPALAIGPDGSRHLAWFNVVNGAGSLLHQSLAADGTPLIPATSIGGDQAGHPALLALEKNVYLAWKAFDGQATRIGLSYSDDGGRHWRLLPSPAAANAASDHPQLLARQGQPYLIWNTADQGLQVIALEKL